MAGWKTVASIYSRVGNLKSATSLSKSPFFLLLLFSFLKNKRENSWGSNSPMLKYTVGSCSGIQRESLDLLGAICFIITEFGSQLCPLPCLPSLLAPGTATVGRWHMEIHKEGCRKWEEAMQPDFQKLSAIWTLSSDNLGYVKTWPKPFPAEHSIIQLSVTVPNTPSGSKAYHLMDRASQICFTPIPLQCPAKENSKNKTLQWRDWP